MKQFLWIGHLLLALPLISCEATEHETKVASKRPREADVPVVKAHSWCEAKIGKAKLRLPRGFVMTRCSTWNVSFSRPEYGLGSRWFGKPQAPSTSITIWFLNRWPQGLLEGPIVQAHGEPRFEENAIAANGGPNQIPDVSGLKKAMERPIGWDTHEGADIFKYYYYAEDESVFCEGFIRQRLFCGVRGGEYFMTWLYSGRDVETNLTEMLTFRKANAMRF